MLLFVGPRFSKPIRPLIGTIRGRAPLTVSKKALQNKPILTRCWERRTNRLLAARIDLCPHGSEVGSHGTAGCPHGSDFRRTEGKMAARNDFLPHGTGDVPHETVSRLRETIFARTKPWRDFALFDPGRRFKMRWPFLVFKAPSCPQVLVALRFPNYGSKFAAQ
jgi:hypothetical protein